MSTAQILYQSAGLVRVVMPDGSGDRVVAPDVPVGQEHPAWSPDGSEVLFDADFSRLWAVAADGSEGRVLYECDQPCQSLQDGSWSPDGGEVAFMVAESLDGTTTSRSAIVALDLASNEVRTVYEDTSGVVWLFNPSWSPDGSAVVFEASTFASNLLSEGDVVKAVIAIVPAAGGDAVEVATGTGPDWSPRGDLIVFERDDNLFLVAPDGSGEHQLTRYDGIQEHAIQPTFAPTGDNVVFTYVAGRFGIDDRPSAATVGLDGSGFTALADGQAMTHPRLQP